MRRHKRENQILKGLIRAAAGVAACVAGLILFFCIYLVERAAYIPAD